MTQSAYSRKKQPDLVRRAILDEAIRLSSAHGPGAITIQAVALAAGVTKGGVFHHFASKQALIDGVYADVMERIDAAFDRYLETDTAPGCFTRAYVDTLMLSSEFGMGSPFDVIGMTTLTSATASRAWVTWLDGRLERHKATDSGPLLEIVRFAADGAWLAHIGGTSAEALGPVVNRLLGMTR